MYLIHGYVTPIPKYVLFHVYDPCEFRLWMCVSVEIERYFYHMGKHHFLLYSIIMYHYRYYNVIESRDRGSGFVPQLWFDVIYRRGFTLAAHGRSSSFLHVVRAIVVCLLSLLIILYSIAWNIRFVFFFRFNTLFLFHRCQCKWVCVRVFVMDKIERTWK